MHSFTLRDWIVLSILFISALWLWTLPIQDNPYPFGEGDAAWHFANGDYAGQTGNTFWRSPFYIGTWYYGYNKALGPFALEYPPPWHVNQGIFQIIGGERIVPAYIYIALSCFLTIFAGYFFMRKLYGFYPALITGAGLLFSLRDILGYIWGQRPGIASFVFIPLILYTFYQALISHYEKKPKPIYWYLFALLFSSSYLFHLQATIFILPTLALFTLFIIISKRSFPFSRSFFTHAGLAAGLLALICLPFAIIYLGTEEAETNLGIHDVSRLFSWLEVPPNNFSMDPIFSSYSAAYGSIFTVVLVLLGILILLLRRDSRDYLMLSMLGGLYIVFHLDVFGIADLTYRLARYLSVETFVFYALMAIGITSFMSFFPIGKQAKNILTIFFTSSFILFIVVVSGGWAYNYLDSAYDGQARITSVQYQATEWIKENIQGDDEMIVYYGTFGYAKQRFFQVLSQVAMFPIRTEQLFDETKHWANFDRTYTLEEGEFRYTHVLFDYSDFAPHVQNPQIQPIIGAMQAIEQQVIEENHELIYDANNIKVYEVAT